VSTSILIAVCCLPIASVFVFDVFIFKPNLIGIYVLPIKYVAAILMTVSALEGHSPIASLFKWDLCTTHLA